MKKIKVFNTNPHLLIEKESGIFEVARIIETDDKSWSYEANSEHGELILGESLIELPNRNLSLLLKIEKDTPIIFSISEELKKFAEISAISFITYETFSDEICRHITSDSKFNLIEVKPRIFKKIKNSDEETLFND
ncbi:hypothetical protein HOD75_03690 [archaeon]|jgi:hypothetical protein|nr:hypothetical protein [archaeon]MBT4241973.1 hypothetical protein [archaeon]MBT4418520.1 hypothetical protein [archaeon]